MMRPTTAIFVVLLISLVIVASSIVRAQWFDGDEESMAAIMAAWESDYDDQGAEFLAESDASSSAAYDQCVTASALNIRSGPGTGYSVVGSLGQGARVSVTSSNSGWAQVGSGRWVSSEYLGNCPGATTQCVTADALNIRSGPGTGYSVVGSLGRGERVSVSSSSNGWAQIGSGRFVSAEYLGGCGGSPPSSGGGLLSFQQLKSIMNALPDSKANEYLPHINNAMREGSITTCLRKSAFLAQLAHESVQLRYMEEIASGAAYEGRKDLGNIYPGDGVRYKGRGPIQLTGRANYRAAGNALGLNLEGNPTMAATPAVGFRVAVWYWSTRSLNQYADNGTQGGFDTITRLINGGFNGKADRDMFWRKARGVLGC